MIMRPGQQLLLQANPLFIWATLFAALFANMLFNMLLWGRSTWVPDILSVVLVFWTVNQTLRVGVTAAFIFGLFMDVYQGGLLGQHAMAYTVLSFLAIMIHRRLLWFSLSSQALQVLPLFAIVHVVEIVLTLVLGGSWPSWTVIFAPLFEAMLWPVLSVVLLAPQRRAPDPDENRPL